MDKNSAAGGADIISVCFICDENFVMPTVVAITSIKFNKNREDFYDVYIVANNLSDASLEILHNLEGDCCRILIIQVDVRKKYDKFEMKHFHVTTTALLKFELPDILPADLEKVLYLDGDIIVQKDLAPVFRERVDDVYAGVVLNATNKNNVDFQLHLLHLNINHKEYFNSGVLLLNLKKMREDSIPKKLMEHKNKQKDKYMDQDTFNVVLRENVKYMSFYYNFQYVCWMFDQKELTDYYNLEKVDTKYEWIPNAVIIHYTWRKPWQYFDYFAADVWLHYYLLSPFKDKPLVRASLNEEIYAKYSTLRIDIRNRGTKNNNVIEKSIIPKQAFLRRPSWLANGMTIESAAERMTVVLQCQGDGELEIGLMGRDVRNVKGKRYPIWIDCTSFAVNGEVVFNDTKTVCHDKRYVYRRTVTDGEVIRLDMTWTDCQSSNVLDENRQLQSDLKNKSSEVIRLDKEKTIINEEKTIIEKELGRMQQEVVRLNKERIKTAEKLKKSEMNIAKVKKELNNVKNGWSYRIGRMITWLPRKVKGFLKQ